MKAIILHAAGDLRVEEIAPAEPARAGEVRVAISHGGICGSDLHYYHHGGFGAVRLREPMALGHEVSGRIVEVGEGVTGLAVGDGVAVNPSRPCGACAYCAAGQRNQCTDMRFNGSAMRMPHEQGLFRAEVTVPAGQAIRFGAGADLAHAALCEPLAVCLHAVARAGDLTGKRVLVSGCGPIGCLTIAAAKLAGAADIIATDLAAAPLAVAMRMGATRTLDLTQDQAAFAALSEGKGQMDVTFECSGAPVALQGAIAATRAGGTVILVGMGGDVPMPLGTVVAKEITLKGTFRFDPEFAQAAALIDQGKIDVSPMVTGIFDAKDAVNAFEAASDRSRAMKVQIQFSGV